jgi:uncharacterized protein YjiS (DUF1127 family)
MSAKARAIGVSGNSSLRAAFAEIRLVIAKLRAIKHAIEGRRHLMTMDARMLADIGISASQARHEASRKPWDIAPFGETP